MAEANISISYIEHDIIVNSQATYQAGILIPDRTPGPGDDVDPGAIIF
jgi:hypothetical protein